MDYEARKQLAKLKVHLDACNRAVKAAAGPDTAEVVVLPEVGDAEIQLAC